MGEGHPTGGSLALADLIDRFGEVLIPDLQQHYRIDLRDLFSEDNPLSPAWALMHARHLPMGSATVAEIRGGQQYRGWDVDRYMTARLIDSIHVLRYVTTLAHCDPKKRAPDPPEPYPVPGAEKAKKESAPGSFAFVAAQLLEKTKKRKAREKGGG